MASLCTYITYDVGTYPSFGSYFPPPGSTTQARGSHRAELIRTLYEKLAMISTTGLQGRARPCPSASYHRATALTAVF